jgi:hypothetical protein
MEERSPTDGVLVATKAESVLFLGTNRRGATTRNWRASETTIESTGGETEDSWAYFHDALM